MPRNKKPDILYSIVGFTVYSHKAVFAKTTTDRASLAVYISRALDAGATIITIRRIHQPTQPKLLDTTPPATPGGKESENGS